MRTGGMNSRHLFPLPAVGSLLVLTLAACSEAESVERTVAVIHLEDRLDSAQIEGGVVRPDSVKSLRWSFEKGAAGWQGLPNFAPGATAAEVAEVEGALRIRMTESSRAPQEDGEAQGLIGGVYLDVPDFNLAQWTHVLVHARATGPVEWVGIGYDVRKTAGATPEEQWPTRQYGAGTDVQPGDAARLYRFPVRGEGGRIHGPVQQIAILFGAQGPAQIEISSVTLLPASATFAEAGVGVRSVSSDAHTDFGPQRRALYTHTPTRIAYALRLPPAARLDLALGALAATTRMRVEVEVGGARESVLDELVPPDEAWRQRSIDLTRWSEQAVTLTLVAQSEDAAAPGIALWASPTISAGAGADPGSAPKRPNVIFYVIDGASAGLMSVYGYERPTTPNLERIAAEGVLFERAHSNATWTMPSTASFMTSLHHSVLGGLRDDANPIPPNVKTMAEHFHDAGFHTGVFTFNPNAGALSGLDRGVDVFRDFGKRGAPWDPIEAISSKILHEQFWDWRDAYPGPYWVHFQTTDVHPPHHPPAPFAGRVIDKQASEALASQMMTLRFPFRHTSASVHEHWQGQLKQRGIDPKAFYGAMQDSHDEAMMHQDHRLGELVDRLKERGEWENTLLVIGSDHGHPAASYPRFGRGQLDPQPPAWEGALLGEFESHVPLIIIWPGHIQGGRRIEAPVSMIDVLPTILDLVGLPAAKYAQGQSLAPLLLGKPGWTPRPVVFNEFRFLEDGSMIGNLEVLDGRWGESLEIRTSDAASLPTRGRHPAPAGGRWAAREFADVSRFLLYDVAADPRAIANVTADHPEVAREAQLRLWRIWQEHQALAALFEAGEEAEISPQQLEALRALGYAE